MDSETMNGIWVCACQSCGGDLYMGAMSTDSGFSIRLNGKKKEEVLRFLLLEFHVRFVIKVYCC